jgi:hypothetical protein
MVKKKRKPRKCGACGDIGHDKRTCTAQPVWGSTTAPRIIKAEEPKKSPKQTLEELRQEETENTLSALVSLVNDYASAAGVKMHLEPSHRVGNSTVWLVNGPDLDNVQAVAAMAGAIHQAQTSKEGKKDDSK